MYNYLDWDSIHFGLPVFSSDSDLEELQENLEELKDIGAKLVYWKTTAELNLVLGGVLVDEKVTYVRKLKKIPKPDIELEERLHLPIEKELYSLAINSGHLSRFFKDPQIPKKKAKEVFRQWVENSVSGKLAFSVLVHRGKNEKVNGFITIGEKEGRGDIGLIAIADPCQGQGLGYDLVNHALLAIKEKGWEHAQVVTQADNIGACKLYEKCGFTVEKKEYFYHFWL